MLNVKKILIALSIIIISGVALVLHGLPVSGTWKYKITINIETPEGIKSGSAVREVSNSAPRIKIFASLPQSHNAASVRGEAVVIDLGDKGILFGLVSDRSQLELYDAFSKGGATTLDGIKHLNSIPVGKKAYIVNNIPTLVRFKNISDPKSIELVHYQRYDNITNKFKETLGEGYQLSSVQVELVDEPLSNNTDGLIPVFGDDFWEWRKTLKSNDKRKITGSNLNRGAIK